MTQHPLHERCAPQALPASYACTVRQASSALLLLASIATTASVVLRLHRKALLALFSQSPQLMQNLLEHDIDVSALSGDIASWIGIDSWGEIGRAHV